MLDRAVISSRGARRWEQGHPWIYRSDVLERPSAPPGAVPVFDTRGKPQGWALWSPSSEISLRLLDRNPDAIIERAWWRRRIEEAVALRARLRPPLDSTAYRLVHAEGDSLPSLVCDRYDRWLVVQFLSAAVERFRDEIVAALEHLLDPAGILARNDVPVRSREGLSSGVELLFGSVPEEIEVLEHGVRFLAAPWTGQKTGAFLDQRENRVFMGGLARGRALDCFSYHGSFAVHLARSADSVVALDASAAALARARENVERNGFRNVELVEANAFEYLKASQRLHARFDVIVLDPPAFAKSRGSVPAALRGYKEVNLRAMRLLSPGGVLFTASCSFHLDRPAFLEVLRAAAADSGRRMRLRELRGQAADHPELLNVPETGYLKAAVLEAVD